MLCRKIFVPVLGLALAGMACATTTFYTNQASFNAATSSLTFQTISDLSTSEYTASGLVDPSTGVTFTDQSGGSSLLNVVSASTLGLTSGFTLGIQVPGTYTAYWFDIASTSSGSAVNESSSSPFSSNGFTFTSPIFFGVVTDTAVTGLQVGGGTSGVVEIENFNVAGSAVSATPEGTTMLMIGGGLILLRGLRSRGLLARA